MVHYRKSAAKPMKQGMRHALRSLARTPAFAAIAILTLAVGIGTNTTIFAIVDELVFKPVRGVGYENVYHLGSIQIPDYETLGANPPEGFFVPLSRVATLYYFFHFIVLLPILGKIERPLPLPPSIADAVLKKKVA